MRAPNVQMEHGAKCSAYTVLRGLTVPCGIRVDAPRLRSWVLSHQSRELFPHLLDFRLHCRFGIRPEREIVLIGLDSAQSVARQRGQAPLFTQGGREIPPAPAPTHRPKSKGQI